MTEEIYTLKAKSSSGDYYIVTFNFDGGKVRVQCTCKSGSFRDPCKHKDGFLTGDDSLLFDENEKDLCSRIASHVNASNFPAEFEKFQKDLDEIEVEKKKLNDKSKALKKEFGKRLFEGI